MIRVVEDNFLLLNTLNFYDAYYKFESICKFTKIPVQVKPILSSPPPLGVSLQDPGELK